MVIFKFSMWLITRSWICSSVTWKKMEEINGNSMIKSPQQMIKKNRNMHQIMLQLPGFCLTWYRSSITDLQQHQETLATKTRCKQPQGPTQKCSPERPVHLVGLSRLVMVFSISFNRSRWLSCHASCTASSLPSWKNGEVFLGRPGKTNSVKRWW